MTGRRPDVLTEAAKQLRQPGRGVETIAGDVSTDNGRETTLKLALEKLGGLDILVNNAGGVRAGRLEDTTETEIRAMIEVDLVAPILLTRAALPALRVSLADAGRLARGQAVLLRGRDAPMIEGWVSISTQGALVGLAEVERGELRPRRIFNLPRT